MSFRLLSICAFALVAVACTGDPRKGGIFFDSSKADMRLAEREQSRAQHSAELAELTRVLTGNIEREAQLRREIAALDRRIAALKQAAADAAHGPSQTEAARIQELQRQKAQLQKEIDILTRQ